MAIVISPVVMALGMIGAANLFLGRFSGVVQLALAAGLGGLMFWIIDPKLRAVSEEYEQQQARHLERLEQKMRWQGYDAAGGAGAGPQEIR